MVLEVVFWFWFFVSGVEIFEDFYWARGWSSKIDLGEKVKSDNEKI